MGAEIEPVAFMDDSKDAVEDLAEDSHAVLEEVLEPHALFSVWYFQSPRSSSYHGADDRVDAEAVLDLSHRIALVRLKVDKISLHL